MQEKENIDAEKILQNNEHPHDLELFITELKQLKEEAAQILATVKAETETTATTTPVGILDGIIKKYRNQAGIATTVRGAAPPQYGVSRMISLLADLPMLEFWIYKKAGIDRRPSFTPFPTDTTLQKLRTPFRKLFRLIKIYHHPYRQMTLEELINEQTTKLKELLSLLAASKKVSDKLYTQLYARHIDMQEDALSAQRSIEKIKRYVDKVERVNKISHNIQIDPKSELGLEVSKLTTYMQRDSGLITEFYDDCHFTVNWLFEVHQSYYIFEQMIGNYSRMINAIHRRMTGMQVYIEDFNRITSRLREGEEITRELMQSMVTLTAGVYASASCIQKSVQEMIGTYGTLETLQLPAFVNQILSGPLTDVMEANQMFQEPSLFSLGDTAPPEPLQEAS